MKGGNAERREEQLRNNSAALGQNLGSASRDMHNNIFELFCRTKAHNKWKMNCLMKHSSFQREGHSLITSRTTKAHQETTWGQTKGMPVLHTPWSLSVTLPLNHCYKTPHQIPPAWRHIGFVSTSPLCPPLPGKAIKLFFSTSSKTLSLQYDSALGYRDWFFSMKSEQRRRWNETGLKDVTELTLPYEQFQAHRMEHLRVEASPYILN